MRRREFIFGAASLVAASDAVAQPQGTSKRLAICSPSEPTSLMYEHSENRYYGALFAELRRLGHVEGQNLVVERYGREKNASGPAAMVGEIIRNNPDVVYAIPPSPPNCQGAWPHSAADAFGQRGQSNRIDCSAFPILALFGSSARSDLSPS